MRLMGKAVVLVLHEINYAAFYSGYICAFVDGKIARFGTVEEGAVPETITIERLNGNGEKTHSIL